MNYPPHTLGAFIAELMRTQGHNNVSLAAIAGVSEGVVRNLLKYGTDPKAKAPDARTLRRVADALNVNALMLFRLADYIPPASNANSVRAEYLADVFDELPSDKQDAVMRVLEAMTDKPSQQQVIQTTRSDATHPLAGFDLGSPGIIRLIANTLVADYGMIASEDIQKIEAEHEVLQYKWKDLPQSTQERVKALIGHKLSLDYDPTMVDSESRE